MNKIRNTAYAFGLVSLVLVFFVGCESPTNVKDTPEEKGTTVDHPTACVESYPVLPDTVVKGLEKWSLKVGDGPRNRCSFDSANEFVKCHSKVEGDTLYTIDRTCPATLKARAELGGD
jgi:hypothetical protein